LLEPYTHIIKQQVIN